MPGNATLVDVAEAVKRAVEERDFGELLVAVERSYADWDMELESNATARVDVVPVGFDVDQETRAGRLKLNCTVDVGLRKRLDSQESSGRVKVSEVDGLMLTLQEMAESFIPGNPADFAGRLPTLPEAVWQNTEIRTAYGGTETIHEMRQYTGIFSTAVLRLPRPAENMTRFRYEDRSGNVVKAAKKAAFRNFGHAAASIRKTASRKIKKRKGAAKPGSPPHTHKRIFLRRALRFAVFRDGTGAVIGPRHSLVGRSARAHEFGGDYEGAVYPARPFMGPSLEENLNRFANEWKGSIGG